MTLNSTLYPFEREFPQKNQNDENYLLLRCLEYDWVHVEEHCKWIIMLFKSQTLQNGNRIFIDICDGRKQLLATDECGNTPLHAACHHKPPESTIHLILKAASLVPDGALQIHTMRNLRNTTPLTIACETGASKEVIYKLLNPPNGLLDSGSVISMVDEKGMTPLLALIARYEALCDAPVLVEQSLFLNEANVEDMMEQSTSSLSLSNNSTCSTTTTQDGSTTTTTFHDSIVFNLQDIMLLASLDTVEIMIRAAWLSSISLRKNSMMMNRNDYFIRNRNNNTSMDYETYISIVHGAAHISDCIPPKLTDLLVRTYKDDILSIDNNEKALHYAVAADKESQKLQNDKNHLHLLYNRKYFIDKLLEVDPTSACRQIPQQGGRTPLCVAIDSSLHWHISTTTCTTSTSSTNTGTVNINNNIYYGIQAEQVEKSVVGPLQTIWKHAPQALYTKDPITGLYPFMLAACVHNTDNNDDVPSSREEENKLPSHNDILQLDTIYGLLRLYPQAITECR